LLPSDDDYDRRDYQQAYKYADGERQKGTLFHQAQHVENLDRQYHDRDFSYTNHKQVPLT
jgi:hypothetical protein